MSEFYLPAFLSYPPSGFSLTFTDETKTALLDYLTSKNVPLGPLGLRFAITAALKNQNREGGKYIELTFWINPSSNWLSSSVSPNTEKGAERNRVNFSRSPLAFDGIELIPNFGKHAVKLYPTVVGQNVYLRVDIEHAKAPPPISRPRLVNRNPERQAALGLAPPAAAPAPATPGQHTVLVLLSLAGQELAFQVPVEEAMLASLEWTKKGYAS